MRFCRAHLPLALAALVSTACTSVRYYDDYDPEVDFTAAATWVWAGDGDPERPRGVGLSPLDAGRVERAITAALTAKDLTESGFPADLWVHYSFSSRDEIDVDAWSSGVGLGWYGSGYYGGTGLQFTVSERTIGTLVIDLLDGGGELIWRGWAVRDFDGVDDLDPREREALFVTLTEGILASFPPAAED